MNIVSSFKRCKSLIKESNTEEVESYLRVYKIFLVRILPRAIVNPQEESIKGILEIFLLALANEDLGLTDYMCEIFIDICKMLTKVDEKLKEDRDKFLSIY